MKKIQKVNPLHLYSLSDYGRLIGESPQLVKYWVKVEKLESVQTQRFKMVLHDPKKEPFNPRSQK
tara:strand:- start:678 stop:872 length:195 start_codon:yes stop_codon:yes gene_type:complete